MNILETGFINSRYCNHFPIPTGRTVSLAVTSTRAGSQLVLHPLQQCSVARGAPHTSARPLNRRLTGDTRPTARASSQSALPGISRAYPPAVTSAKRCPTRSADPVVPRPAALSASSTGARLRCASAIWLLRVWRCILLH